MNKISVVITIYNKEQYLEKCIESVLSQTHKNLEIILVNDGSTDNSLKICEEYIKKDSRIVLINQKNMGVAEALSKGVDRSTGNYIFFLCADDFLDDKIMETLYCLAKSTKADVIESGAILVNQDGKEIRKKITPQKTIKDPFELSKKFNLQNGFTNYVCAKLFKREMFKEIRFENLKVSEDYEILTRIYLNVKHYESTDYCGYYYTMVDNSLSNEPFNEQHLDVIKAREMAIQTYNNNGMESISPTVALKINEWCIELYKKLLLNGMENSKYKKILFRKIKENIPLAVSDLKTQKQKINRRLRYYLFMALPKIYLKIFS